MIPIEMINLMVDFLRKRLLGRLRNHFRNRINSKVATPQEFPALWKWLLGNAVKEILYTQASEKE
jgi:hypothetical protein